jgi:hypothetical protein
VSPSSKLSVGPKTEVLLDKFVYDPKKSTGTVAVEAARGSFRFVTGPQSKGVTYQIKTPFGTLGVRGCDATARSPFTREKRPGPNWPGFLLGSTASFSRRGDRASKMIELVVASSIAL